MKIKLATQAIACFMTVWLTACATLQGSVTETVNHQQVEYALARHANTPTVVFENGLSGTIDWWAKVFPVIAQDTTTFAYNRPGYGKSVAVSTPRDGQHVVDELRALLHSKNLNPPYVLVGHSLGGLYMHLFARRYPAEIDALILVDSTHPAQLKGNGSPENWPTWFRLAFDLAASEVAKEEMKATNATGESVLSLPSFTEKPVLVLSALKPMDEKSQLSNDANEKRKDIAQLYPGSKQIWVDSGHGIPLEKPESVISAIREVLPKK